MLLFKELENYERVIAEATVHRDRVQAQIYTAFKDDLDAKDEGTVNIAVAGYKLKVIKRLNRTIDQAAAKEIDGLGLAKKFSWSKTEYSKLSDDEKRIANKAITTKVGKPTFKLEKLGD